MTTGGRLEIAGVVVGNWGPNCRLHQNLVVQPQVNQLSLNTDLCYHYVL